MKTRLCSLLLVLAATVSVQADIQAPPISDQGPTRKLGRGVANLCFAITDWANTIGEINDTEGNSAAFSYGIVKGAGRFFARTGSGLFDIATFPFPLNKGKYTPILRDDVPWIYGGYEEFPPELGWESRYNYAR
jgi:putative exosortase-associated protein (TIGR04073 family)